MRQREASPVAALYQDLKQSERLFYMGAEESTTQSTVGRSSDGDMQSGSSSDAASGDEVEDDDRASTR